LARAKALVGTSKLIGTDTEVFGIALGHEFIAANLYHRRIIGTICRSLFDVQGIRMSELKKHPSDIAKAAVKYLATLEKSPKTKRVNEEVLWLFIESLKGDGADCVELKDGTYALKANWDAYYGGAISGFLDWFLPRKVMMGDDAIKRVPGILRKFVQWSFDQGYFDEEHREDFMDSLPRGKTGEVKRLRELEKMLFTLHSPDPGAWARGELDKVKPLNAKRRPEKVEEGYMEFVRADGDTGYFRADRKKIGPVLLTKAITSKFKAGDVANLTVGKFGDAWHVLETGNVYPEGTMG
jgi:hypothetical protein